MNGERVQQRGRLGRKGTRDRGVGTEHGGDDCFNVEGRVFEGSGGWEKKRGCGTYKEAQKMKKGKKPTEKQECTKGVWGGGKWFCPGRRRARGGLGLVKGLGKE